MRLPAVLLLLSSSAVVVLGGCGSGDDGRIPPPSAGSLPVVTEPATTTATAVTDTGLAPVPKMFNPDTMREDVRRVLTDGYAIDGVDSVTCPAGQPVEDGTTFDCTALIDGENRQVPITVQGDDGKYEVGYPAETDTTTSPAG